MQKIFIITIIGKKQHCCSSLLSPFFFSILSPPPLKEAVFSQQMEKWSEKFGSFDPYLIRARARAFKLKASSQIDIGVENG